MTKMGGKWIAIITMACLARANAQSVPPEFILAGTAFDAPHSLAASLDHPSAVASIPGTSEAYVYESGKAKLWRLDTKAMSMQELVPTLQLGVGNLVNPFSMAVDSNGVLYFPDGPNSRVLRIDPKGVATTIAGSGSSGYSGDGGPATKARLNFPSGTALDQDGNLFILDQGYIRKVTPAGIISTVAGTGCTGPGCGTQQGPAIKQSIEAKAIACDRRGNLFMTEGRKIRVVTRAGDLVTIAGVNPYAEGNGDGGPAAFARFYSLAGIAVGADESIVVSDAHNNVIRGISPYGYASTLAGRITLDRMGDPIGIYRGNGPLTGDEYFSTPLGMAIDDSGKVLIADFASGAIRSLTPGKSLVTVAGARFCCFEEEGIPAIQATFDYPRGLTYDAKGNLYVADLSSGKVRKIDTNGRITTILEDGSLRSKVNVPALESGAQPFALAVDSVGNVYVHEPLLQASAGNPFNLIGVSVRRVTPAGIVEAVVGAGVGEFPLFPEIFETPTGLAIGPDDSVYYVDGCRINNWKQSRIQTIMGNQCAQSYSELKDNVPAKEAVVGLLTALVVDAKSNLYLADSAAHYLRVVKDGMIRRFAGKAPDDRQEFRLIDPMSWQLFNPIGLALGTLGDLFVADHIFTFGNAADGSGLAIGNREGIYAVDQTGLGRGVLVSEEVSSASGSSTYYNPFRVERLTAIAASPLGGVVVAEPSSHRLLQFTDTRGFR